MFKQIKLNKFVNICIIFPLAYNSSSSKPSNTQTTCLGLICKLSKHNYDYIIYDLNYITSYIVTFLKHNNVYTEIIKLF